MDTGPLVQPERQVEELAGDLQVPDLPVLSAGYADIYHGIWTRPDGIQVDVAVKELKVLIPKNRQSDPEALQRRTDTRMKREVLAWSQTTHPNLHPLLGYRSKPRPRLISLWCRHGNLTDYLLKNPGLSKIDKLRFIHQTGRALLHLHSQAPPICHADIKPENVLINDCYEASLSDFGLSRVLQDCDESSGLTTSETVKGTLNYMAGELFLGEKAKPGRETDVYAFGGLILTVMSGNPPYFKLRGLNIMLQATQYQPPRPEDHPDLPPSDPLWILIRRCWSKTPSTRPTMREILGELDGYINITRRSSESIPCAPSAVQNEVGESLSSMNLHMHAPNTPPQGQFLALLSLNPAPVDGSSMTAIEATDKTITEGTSHAHEIFKNLEVNSKGIPVVGRYVAAIAHVGLALVGMIQTMDENEELANALWLKVRMLATLLDHVKQQSGLRRSEEIASRIIEIKRELQSAQGIITKWSSSELRKNALSSCDRSEGLRACERTVRKVLEEIELLGSLDATSLVAEFEDAALQKDRCHLLDRLGDGNYGGQGNMIEDITCLPGTRVEILDRIDSWIRDTLTSERVLWICGMAGRGKSTIASTVAHSWKYRASCAIFHFRRGRNDLNARLICALARQLGSSLIPEVKTALLESVRENEDVANQRLDEQFKILLVASLGKLKDQLQPILIVVDALDECETTKDVTDFIKLIDRHSSSLPPNVKFLLTCRPESSLLRAIEPKKWPAEDLDSASDVSSDLALFIIRACTEIRDDHNLPENWPSPGDVGRLVEMSQGLFQWAQTAITHVGDGPPVSRLRGLLQNPTICGLDNLYHQILSKVFKDAEYDPMRHRLLYWIIGSLALAPYPVSLDVIVFLYADSGAFKGMDLEEILRTDVLGRLKSILFIPVSSTEPIRLMHTSIRDLLLDPKRCKEKPYFVGSAQDNRRLASLYLRLMDRDLRHNICNLSDLSTANWEVQDMVERRLQRGLQYCCRSWSIHLIAGIEWSGTTVEAIDDIWTKFKLVSETKFLYWLEVMSLIGAITEAFNVAQGIYHWLQQRPNELSGDILPSLWNDAQRFIAAFREPISFGALHIYWSALPHCPAGTKLWEKYGGQARTRILLGPKRQSSWPRNIWTTYAGEGVEVVRFSPDGKAVVSGSQHGAVCLWDAGTGALLGDSLTGHSASVESVSFSPDGKVLASGSRDQTVRLWDAGTGAPLRDPLIGHSEWVTSVSFSPDGKVLASGSCDKTVRLWDAGTGAPLRDPLIGHSKWVTSVSFSPDGKVLASGSWDKMVRLWDAGTGAPLRDPLIGHSDPVESVSFSADGKVLASGSVDGTVRLWDAGTGAPLRDPLIGHSEWVTSVSFSPDGKVLASGSQDRTVRLWDAGTGAPLGDPLIGHSESVTSVSFSPDGKVLASGSWDRTVRLWDALTGEPLDDLLTGDSDPVTSASFSSDGKILASASKDGTIRLWDAGNGAPLGDPLTGHSRDIKTISFSPDGKILASGSVDGTVRLWDAGTGAPLRDLLIGHSEWVTSVSFSPDGKVLASGSQDGTVRLWDTGTGAPLHDPLIGHSEWVTSVSFSPDGKVLASGSWDKTVRLWDAETGAPLGDPLIGHSYCVMSVSFSPNGKLLASGSHGETVRLWDAGTGAPLVNPLTGEHNWVECYLSGKWPSPFPQHCTTSSLDPPTPRTFFELPGPLDWWNRMDASNWFTSRLDRLWLAHIPKTEDGEDGEDDEDGEDGYFNVIPSSGRLALLASDRSMLLILDLPPNTTLQSIA